MYLPSSIQRIQVKAGYWDKDKWVIGLTNGGKGNKRAYEKSDFDFLAFNGPEQQLYLVPSIDLHLSRKGGKSLPTASSGMHIRYSDYLIYAPN